MIDPDLKSWETISAVRAVCGALGAFMTLLFYRPVEIAHLKPFALGVVTGAIGALTAVFFTGQLLAWLGAAPTDLDATLAAAGLIGMFSLGFVGWVGMFMSRRSGKDIADVIEEVRGRFGGRNE